MMPAFHTFRALDNDIYKSILEDLPRVAEDYSGYHAESIDGKVVQLRNAEGDRLYPVSAGDMELRRNYYLMADELLALKERCERLERALNINDSSTSEII